MSSRARELVSPRARELVLHARRVGARGLGASNRLIFFFALRAYIAAYSIVFKSQIGSEFSGLFFFFALRAYITVYSIVFKSQIGSKFSLHFARIV